MNRKLLIAALAGAGIVVAGAALYFTDTIGRQPGALAVLTPKAAKTTPFWPARVTTLAGDGIPGTNDGPAATSRFSDPFGVAIDSRGAIYLADGGESNRIRKINPDGTVATFAGGSEGFRDGKGAAAAFHTPSALAFDHQGMLYVADTGNNAIRRIAPDGTVTTLAGGTRGILDGMGRAAQFNGPVGIAVDDAGIVYVADTYNDRIRRISKDGSVTTVAGSGKPGNADGAGTSASFDTPSAIAVATDGTLYVADTGNHAIRSIAQGGAVTTVAVPPEGPRRPGEPRPVLRRPVGLALTRDGYLYIAAGSGGRILQRTPEGEYRALQDADVPPSMDGFGPDGTVQLYGPRGIAVQPDGSLVVADAASHRLHRLGAPRAGEAAPLRPQPVAVRRTAPMPWPVGPQDMAHEVVGVMGEVRGSYNGDSRDHFHAGLDVRADVGAKVLAVFPSKVSDPFANWGFDSLSEGISLGPLSYIHMRVGRDSRGKPLDPRFQVQLGERGKAERVRVPRGTRFAVGDPIGTINAMAHVHLDYYQGGAVVNPLTLPFVGFTDTVAPRINSIALFDGSGKRLQAKKREPLRVPRALGEVNIVVDAWDQVDGNLARRRLGLYKLGYQLLKSDGSAVAGHERPLITQVYDRLPRNPDAVKLVYAPNSGITVYGSKATHFAYAVNNRLQDGEVKAGSWQVGALAPGDYILRIYAADYAGQVALDGRDLALSIE